MSELTNLSTNELQKKILDLKKELVFYKIKKATKQDIKPHIIKSIKNKIAQMLTQASINKKLD